MSKYVLELTEEQARTVSNACEFFARMKMGQFQEVTWNCMDSRMNTEDFCYNRDKAEELLFEARKYIFPDLHGRGHSYGIGKSEDADMAFDVHQVLRYKIGVDNRRPFSPFDKPLPVCTVIDEEQKIEYINCKNKCNKYV